MYKVSPAFSKAYQRKFLNILLLWAFSAFVVSQMCEYIGVVTIPVIELIPSIDAYAAATKYSCQVYNVWTYGWVVSPLVVIFIFKEGSKNYPYEPDWQGRVLSLGALALSFYICVFGIYDKYPGDNSGRISYQFRETEVGAVLLSIIFWAFFWSMVMVNYQWIKGLFRFYR